MEQRPVDYLLLFNQELAMSKYTWNRFKPDFLENETLCDKQIFVLYIIFIFS